MYYRKEDGVPRSDELDKLDGSTEHNTPVQGAIYQITTQDVGYYAILVVRTYLNLCLVSLCLPSNFRSGELPTISYLNESQGRPAVKTPTFGAHHGADRPIIGRA